MPDEPSLAKAKTVVEPGEAIPLAPPARRDNPMVVLTADQLAEVVADLESHDSFVVDIETIGGLNPIRNEVTWIALSTDKAVHLIPINHPNGAVVTDVCRRQEYNLATRRPLKRDPSQMTMGTPHTVTHPATFAPPPKQLRPDVVFAALRPIFFSDRLIINHNLKYDLHSMAKYWGGELPPGPYADTLVGIHLLDESRLQKGLKPVTREWYLGIKSSDREAAQKFYPEMGKAGVENFSLADAARYCAQDVTFTHRLYRRIMRVMADEDLLAAWDLDMSLYGPLMGMEQAGIMIDKGAVSRLDDHLALEVKQLEVDVARICGVKFPLTNLAAKRKYLFGPVSEGGQGLKPLGQTPKGLDKLDAGILAKYADTNELAALFKTHTELAKLHTAFVKPFSKGDILDGGRVRTRFNLHRTDTGRLSSSEPNLQQIPVRSDLGKSFRECFVADQSKGRILVVADYSQIELRVAAHVSGDPEMVRVLSTGEDIHRAAAAGALQKPMEDVTDEERSVVGKVVNFLIIYGGGAKKLQQSVHRPLQECEDIINSYFEAFGGLQRMKSQIIHDAVRNGDRSSPTMHPPYVVIPPTGRRRRLPGLFSDNEYDVQRAQRQAVNAVIQGFAANIMKMALVDVSKSVCSGDTRMLLTVHDEIVVETSVDKSEEVLAQLLHVMGNVSLGDGTPVLGKVPLLAEGGIGYTWVSAK